jgi:hypothetical protein
MNKLMFIIGIMMLLFTKPVNAEQTITEAYIWNHESINNGRERFLNQNPTVDILYDSAERSIKFISTIDCDDSVNIYVYNSHGELIDYANSLDSVIYIHEVVGTAIYFRIESDSWYATATINV